ncbi:cytochrome c peroxidase [Chitinophaga jiangningensis]|uniref:Cytochrome c peroxidase n=1 Tax=Chitinophaga jiangningensis TaxID=1419482 RepID=A0A1M7JZK6_9BACT|nr:cytochrome c peroxidase [Chitinophaga jiangningensis]SHM57987.1 cytochrome c peroxidase [Chitinophaga jiangningensis]
MKTNQIFFILFFATGLLFSFITPTPVRSTTDKVESYYREGLDSTYMALQAFSNTLGALATPKERLAAFYEARQQYKQIELLLEYYQPHLARSINGPALPYADGESSKDIIPPAGFQVIEEMLQAPNVTVYTLIAYNDQLISIFRQLIQNEDPVGFQDKWVFDAMRLEVYRIIALGISGYDSPVLLHSMPEAAAALTSIRQVLAMYDPVIASDEMVTARDTLFNKAVQYLHTHSNFNRFDRLHFITNFANPISRMLLTWQNKLGIVIEPERRILLPTAPHLFATSYYQPNGYTPSAASDPTPEKVALGKLLFADARLSGDGSRSCASCHKPELAFTDGLTKSPALDGIHTVTRNTPTLLNVGFQSKLFYDSRANFIEDQVFAVVHNTAEMNGSLQQAAAIFQKDTVYRQLFQSAFPADKGPLSTEQITNALASYLRSLTSLNSRFDQYMNGDSTALTPREQKGFNLFMGKAKCGTCHFAPLFNGVAPPYFAEPESEVLGVPATRARHAALDTDAGKYHLYPISIFKYAFKTPSVRNSMLTAPYMHNGVFTSMKQVINFYNKGGGAGLHTAPENQTLPEDKLRLSGREKRALIAFLGALNDTAQAGTLSAPAP